MSELANRIRRQMVQAINDYDMIQDGDRLMVAVSGGKDSAVLLALLGEVKRRAKIDFTVKGVMLDQKQPGFDAERFTAWVEGLGIDFTIIERDTYAIVKEKVEPGKTYCGLCSRLRRGILYNYAVEHGFTKIALGHHRDDLNETLLLNLFYTGRIASMPPKLRSDDGRNVVIRPLCYVAEDTIAELAGEWSIPVMPCNLCGSQDNLRRAQIKKLLAELGRNDPHIANSMLSAQQNVRPSQLSDHGLWDFAALNNDAPETHHAREASEANW